MNSWNRLASAARNRARNRGWIVAALFVAALAFSVDAAAQQFPPTLGPNSVYGRLGVGSGPGQAIPLATLKASLFAGTPTTWTADQFFASGRPWCDIRANGAVQNGSASGGTDDTAAWNACIATLTALGGGTIYVPPGAGISCIKSGPVNLNAKIAVVGAVPDVSSVGACGTDNILFTVNSNFVSFHRITLWGKGSGGDTGTLGGTTNPVILIGAFGGIVFDEARVHGGSNALFFNGAFEVTFNKSLFTESFGGATVYITGGGGAFRFFGSSIDQVWPISLPSAPLTLTAWTNGHTYNVGDVATITQSAKTYIVQVRVGGTSGASAPALANYAVDIADGATLKWRLVAPSVYTGVQCDTGCSEITFSQTDFTGPFTNSLSMTNTLAGTAPSFLHVEQSTFSQTTGDAISLIAGASADITDSEILGCLGSGCAGVKIDSAWAGRLSIKGGQIGNNAAYGVRSAIATSSLSIAPSVVFFSNTTADVSMASTCTNCSLYDNNVEVTPHKVQLSGVTSPHYTALNTTAGTNGAAFYQDQNGAAYVGNADAFSFNIVTGGASNIRWGFSGADGGMFGDNGGTPVTGGSKGANTINTAGLFVNGNAAALTTATLAQFAATTSAQLAGVLSDETGSGAAVFAASPTLSGTIGGNLIWSGTQQFSGNVGINKAPTGVTLDMQGATNQFTFRGIGSSTSGQSFGFNMLAGTTSADKAFEISNQANSLVFMTVYGDGGISTNGAASPGQNNYVSVGSVKSSGATAGIGYATGAGGTVTQTTNRTTGVTINKVAGAITLVSAAGSATPATFTVTNSAVAATDVIKVVQQSGTDLYEIFVTNVTAGSFKITSFTTGGTTTEQPVFNFVVLKGVSS